MFSTSLRLSQAQVQLKKLLATQSKNNQRLEEELVKEWVAEPELPDMTPVPTSLLSDLDQTEVSLPLELWNVDQMQRAVSNIDDEYIIRTEWALCLSLRPDLQTHQSTNLQNVRLDLQFSTLSSGQILGLAVSCTSEGNPPGDLLLLPSEIDPLTEYVTDNCETDLYLRAMHEYLNKSADRSDVIQSSESAEVRSELGGGLCITFWSEETDLGSMVWQLKFSERAQGFVETYTVRLTGDGDRLARECNLPEDLIKTGLYEQWSPKEALGNLRQMVSLGGVAEDVENKGEKEKPKKRKTDNADTSKVSSTRASRRKK